MAAVLPTESCPRCGLSLSGPEVQRLREIDSSIQALESERAQLLGSLRGSASVGEAPLKTEPGPGGESAGGGWRPTARAGGHHSGQQLLLGLGALLVVVAALVFVAVAWQDIGVLGQIAVIVAVTLGVGAGAELAARRGLSQTGTALAWLTGALFVVDASAARSLGLVPEYVDSSTYVAAVALAGLVCFVAADATSRVATFGVIAVVFAQVPALAFLDAAGAGVEAVGFTLLAQAWANAGALIHLGGQPRRTAALAAVLALAAAAAIALELSSGDAGARPWLGVALGLLCAATAGVWGVARPEAATISLAGGVLGGVELALAADLAGGVTGTTVLAAVAAAGLGHAYIGWRTSPGPATVVLVALAASAYVSALAGLVGGGHAGAVTLAVGALALASTVVSTAGRRLEACAPAAAAWWCTLAAGLAWHQMAEGPAGVVLAVGTAGLVAAAWRAPNTDVELATLAAAAVAGCISLSVAMGGEPRHLAAALAVVGLATLVASLREGWAHLALAGVPLLSGAGWVLLADADVTVVEAYSLPLAALCLLVGVVRYQRHPTASSWVTWGPVVTAGLVPSTVVALSDEGLTRPLLVLVIGTVTVIVGVYRRWQAPVVTAGVCVAAVALAQVGPYAAAAPRWLSLGTLGLVLLVAGATYEARVRNLRRAAAWVSTLE